MKINKFINNAPLEDVIHSNELAKVAGGDMLGSVSPETFSTRSRIDRSRTTIRQYGHSLLGQGTMKQSARLQLNANNPLRRSEPRIYERQQRSVMGVPPPHIPPRPFQEPPARGFNPYK